MTLMDATHVTHAEKQRWMHPEKSSLSASRQLPTLAPICRRFRRRCQPTCTPRCSPASTIFRPSIVKSTAFYTNTAPVDAYRGAGRPEATFVVERLVEIAAREMGKDPAQFRMHNFITTFPHQTPVIMAYDVGDYGGEHDEGNGNG